MFKHFKIFILISILILGLSDLGFCEAPSGENLTITTYYPSPYGSYDKLQTNKMSVGDTNGDGQLTDADLPTDNGELKVAKTVNIHGVTPFDSMFSPFGGYPVRLTISTDETGAGKSEPLVLLASSGLGASINFNADWINYAWKRIKDGSAFQIHKIDSADGNNYLSIRAGKNDAVSETISWNDAGSGITLNDDDHVGINNTDFAAPLTVSNAWAGDTARILVSSSTDSEAAIGFLSNNNGLVKVYSPGGTNDLRLATGNPITDRMTIKDTGNVGIGTTDPQTNLQVNGVIYSTGRYPGVLSNGIIKCLGGVSSLADGKLTCNIPAVGVATEAGFKSLGNAVSTPEAICLSFGMLLDTATTVGMHGTHIYKDGLWQADAGEAKISQIVCK